MNALSLLSLVWFSLCTSLVARESDLIVVFISFVLSFTLAYILIGVGTIVTMMAKPSTSDPMDKQRTTSAVDKSLSFHARIKHTVAAILYSSVILFLLLSSTNSIPHLPQVEYMVVNQRLSIQYYCLGIIAGYLTFELWYDQMYCCTLQLTSLLSLMENTATLSFLCVILYRWRDCFTLMAYDEQHHFFNSTIATAKSIHIPLSNNRILLWLFYRVTRSILDIVDIGYYSYWKFRWTTTVEHSKTKVISEKDPIVTTQPTTFWIIHGQKYDLSDFIERHPGGKEAILLGRGRDCTALFESYHPFTTKHRYVCVTNSIHVCEACSFLKSLCFFRHILEKFRTASMNSEIKDHVELDPFYEILKSRVSQQLLERGIHPEKDRCATYGRFTYYTIILILLFVSAYYHIQASLWGSFFFAICGWLIGALGHDAGHFAASRNPMINDVAVWGMSLLCNPIMWQHQHTYAHHSHTNDSHHDPDLHHFDILLRVHRRCKYKQVYRNQTNVVWVILAYTLVVFGTCIKIPISVMTTGCIYGIVENTDRKRRFRSLCMLLHYIGYLGIIVVAPFFSTKSWTVCISCPLLHLAVAGLLFAFFSQINHLNEKSLENQYAIDGLSTTSSWAINQVVTSNNFAVDSIFWHFFSNGLNMQIEHHLFPGLNHCHLHHIAPLVKATCDEFRVPYKSYESWSDIMNATLRWLEVLSIDDNT